MPQLGVRLKQVILGTMLSDRFDVRSRELVIENGRGKHKDSVAKGVAGVVCADGDSLDREPEWSGGNKSIYVITPWRLKGQNAYDLPDYVLWGGDEFLVVEVNDYTRYGPGFVEARCVSDKAQDQPAGAAVRP